jgi:flavin-dependent dehydrogenase
MQDVLIAGGGPAGTLAAIVLARAGARVRVVERDTFPRHKLCGDTFNPGALRVLESHLATADLRQRGLPLAGMLLTGPGGVSVRGAYGPGLAGCSVRRADADAWLAAEARRAGATVDEGLRVDGLVHDGAGAVAGVTLTTPRGARETCRAPIIIAADGRASRLARQAGLARLARRPRRWAIGGYFTGVEGLTATGEMHVRRGHYIGVAPTPDGLANACLVVPRAPGTQLRDPAAVLTAALAADVRLGPRFAGACLVGPPTVLGPMAVDAPRPGVAGLLLAGDAAGFIDPITGDGLHFALRGAVLAAMTAADVLEGRLALDAAPVRLARARAAAFRRKWAFNRTLRLVVSSPPTVVAAAGAARALPRLFQAMIRYAGDCG